MCAFDIDAHNGQDCAGIEPALLYLEAKLRQQSLTIRLRISTQNNEEYKERQSNFDTTSKKIMNEM